PSGARRYEQLGLRRASGSAGRGERSLLARGWGGRVVNQSWRPRGAAGRWLGCALVAVATALVHAAMSTPSAEASGRMRVPSPERARALSFGFEPVIADYYWI